MAALAGLVLLAAGLLQVIVGSRGQFLWRLVVTALSVAVVAATAWWAFTTRRVWKRWLNIVIAALAAANIVLGFLEFGFRQATGALAIVTGALLYATATPRALRPPAHGDPSEGLWTTATPRSAAAVASPTGGPDGAGRALARPGDPTTAGRVPARPRVPPQRRPLVPPQRRPGVLPRPGCW
ncbi:MAG TPA: hypothetical protein VLA80_05435 [Actinomycetota bacterium]|nr:hypothetical protein [Actinomycetota bacterium]